jgi:hypothetical protein
MNEPQIHPVDRLAKQDKNRIYFSRIVDLAVVSGLLVPDPDTEIGHFALSRHYYEGKQIDRDLQSALREFREKYPELVLKRRNAQDTVFGGAADKFDVESDSEKTQDLIIIGASLIGASHDVWPVGTSFVLTYPWDLDGRGVPVDFRPDLSDFMKRRVLAILKKAGKLRNTQIFEK